MYNKEIYEKAYYYELDRLDKIHSRTTIPLSILTLIGGTITNILPKLLEITRSNNTCNLFIILILILLFLISIYLALRSHFGYGYGYICEWKKIDKYEEELKEYYGNETEKIEKELNDYYISILKESRDINYNQNNKRQKYLYMLNILISIQIPLIIIVYTFFHI